MRSRPFKTRALARALALAALAASTAACAGHPAARTASPSGMEPADDSGDAPIVQPGAPGEEARTFSPGELSEVEGVSYTEADVRFMQGMIPHHRQALIMTDLVRAHATTDAVRQMALRMEISQRDEIALMETWLRRHGEPVHLPGTEAGEMPMMPGMLTAEQMEELRNARGPEFDRLFLEYMIQHHQGAIEMVANLFATPGAAQESTVFKFAEDVDADQTMEIQRMQRVLEDIR